MQEGNLISTKRIKIDKANSSILIILSVCSFVFVFSVIASKSLVSQYAYQSKVSQAQQTTVNRLNSNQQAATTLISSYNSFNSQSTNIIGGSSTTTSSNQDGTNSKIILDALPDTYDFPALITSVQNLINIPGLTISNLAGSETSANAPSTTTPVTGAATTTVAIPGGAIALPVTFTVTGPYTTVIAALGNLERSIRPIQVLTLTISGSDSNSTMTVTAQTYYLPSNGFITKKETIQ